MSITENSKVGDSNTYTYTASNINWTVPLTGYFDIYVYGAQGGTGSYSGKGHYGGSYENGAKGNLRASRTKLTKGAVLTIHVGGAGSGSNGGWNDGNAGGHSSTGHNSDGWAWQGHGGGSGGSSYILCSGSKVISASGGRGGNGTGWDANHNSVLTGNGGSAAGPTVIYNYGSTVIWETSALNTSSSNVNGGHGRIVITYAKGTQLFWGDTNINQLYYNNTKVKSLYMNGIPVNF